MADDTTVRDTVLRVLAQIAPDAELDGIDAGADLRETLELDSMDVLNLAIGLYEETGVEIPEIDYSSIVTVNGCVDYLLARLDKTASRG
jgi:acyl carrier protein